MKFKRFEIMDEQAKVYLHRLEELGWIRDLDKGNTFADKFWGVLSPEVGDALDKHIREVREEWGERDEELERLWKEGREGNSIE